MFGHLQVALDAAGTAGNAFVLHKKGPAEKPDRIIQGVEDFFEPERSKSKTE
jgi:hypothetical protein